MKTIQKPLSFLKNGDKFINNGDIYTVFAHEGNMTEVFSNNRFWAWPLYNGKTPTMVNFIYSWYEKVTN